MRMVGMILQDAFPDPASLRIVPRSSDKESEMSSRFDLGALVGSQLQASFESLLSLLRGTSDQGLPKVEVSECQVGSPSVHHPGDRCCLRARSGSRVCEPLQVS